MTKKSVVKKEVTSRINDLRFTGKTDTEIYRILSPDYFDRKEIAKLITATATPSRKEQFKIAQYALLGLLGITILFKVFFALSFALALNSKVALITILIFPAINIFFFVQVYRYEAGIYRLCGIFALIGLTRSITNRIEAPDWTIAVDVVIALAMVGLCFFLDSKLFPNYSPNNMKPDKNGDFKVE